MLSFKWKKKIKILRRRCAPCKNFEWNKFCNSLFFMFFHISTKLFLAILILCWFFVLVLVNWLIWILSFDFQFLKSVQFCFIKIRYILVTEWISLRYTVKMFFLFKKVASAQFSVYLCLIFIIHQHHPEIFKHRVCYSNYFIYVKNE